jgi:hypothetical protein
MATKRKSIIEEALLEAKSLEDALKANTKEMLASHMKEEIETIVESSLKEEDEELEIDVEVGSPDENEEELPGEEKELIDLDVDDIDDVPGKDELSPEEFEDDDESEFDLDLDLPPEGVELELPPEDGELNIDVAELPMDLGDDEIDLTRSPDEDVITVFKAMGDDDEVEVIRDEDGIHLTDNETGAEYYIKESEELEEGEDGMCEGCGSQYGDHDDLMYEIELDEDHDDFSDNEYEGDGSSEEDYDDFSDNEYEGDESSEEEDELEENQVTTRGKGRYSKRTGKAHFPKPYDRGAFESRKPRRPISERRKTPKNVSKVADSKIMKEYKELKSKNKEYKGALKVFKDKLNEVALFNTNLAYVNRLFTEHSTTKKEKMNILKRFDEADSIKGSKSIYKSVKTELDNKIPITKSVGNKVNKTVKSSASDLNESTAYVDPQIEAIKDLMKRIS